MTPLGMDAHLRALLDLHLDRIRLALGMQVVFVARVAGGERRIDAMSGSSQEGGLHVGQILPVSDCPVVSAAVRMAPSVFVGQMLSKAAAKGRAFGVPVLLSDGALFGVLGGYAASPQRMSERVVARKLADFALLITVGLDLLHATEAAQQKLRGMVSAVIREGHYQPVFQPVVDIETGDVIYREGLTRLAAEPPLTIPDLLVAARSVGMGERVELAFARAILSDPWSDARKAPVGINLSETTLRSAAFERFLVEHTGKRIVIELTEHEPVGDYDALGKVVALMRSRGVKLAIDDVGAGFTSLRHMLDLKPDILKIDAAMSARIETDIEAVALLQFLQNYCDETGTLLVVEGIERADQVEALRGIGVRYLQGYHLGEPMRRSGHAVP